MGELEVPHSQIERLTYEPFAFVLGTSILRETAYPSITPLTTIAISPAFVLIHYAEIANLVPTTASFFLPSPSTHRTLLHDLLQTTSAHVHIDFFTRASVWQEPSDQRDKR